MATIDVDELQADACQLCGFSDRQLLIAEVQLLIDSLGGNMDMDEVMADACTNKLDCMSDRQLRIAGVQLMANASLSGGVTYGTDNPPVTPPAGNGGLYYNTATGGVWIWNTATASWDPVIT